MGYPSFTLCAAIAVPVQPGLSAVPFQVAMRRVRVQFTRKKYLVLVLHARPRVAGSIEE